jgi:hypothetical protein
MAAYVGSDTKYHRCRVLLVRRRGSQLDVVLSVESAERFVPERAFATGQGWVEGRLTRPLEVRLGYTGEAEAQAEETVFQHWASTEAVLEISESVDTQGILVQEPATGLFSGMRLAPELLDDAPADVHVAPPSR